jgi:hypothetical protein
MATNSDMEGSDVSPEDAPEDDGNNSFANEVKSFQHNKNLFKVSRCIQEVSSARINDVMNKLNLHLTEFPQSRTGERTLSQNSKQVVDKHWRLLNFVFRKCGYYESLLPLQQFKSKESFIPSMLPKHIAVAIRFKRSQKGTALLDWNGIQVKDILDRDMFCQGGWNDPRCVDQLITAIGTIHEAIGHDPRSPYEDACKGCLELETDGSGHEGCRFHRGRPQIWNKGNPKNCTAMANIISENCKKGQTYVPQGDSPLTPWELLDMGSHLISFNRLWELQTWTMLLISCKQGYRSEEVIKLSDTKPIGDDQIQILRPDLFVISADGILKAIAWDIKGKSDKVIVHLLMWRDDINPELCPVRAFLCFIYLAGYESGYFFMSKEKLDGVNELSSTKNTVQLEESVSYGSYHKKIKKLCSVITRRDGPFGTHLGRKTFYLLSIWGLPKNQSNQEVQTSARHLTDQQARKYSKDARCLLEIAHSNEVNVKLVVSPFKPICIKELQIARNLNASSMKQYQSIDALARDFVEKECGIDRANPNFGIKFLMDAAMKLKTPENLRNEIDTLLSKVDQVDVRTELNFKIEEYAKQARRQAEEAISASTERANIAVGNSALLDTNIVEAAAGGTITTKNKRKRGEGGEDLAERKTLKAGTTAEKLENLLLIKKKILPETVFTEGARCFISEQLNPVLQCLHAHYNNSKEEFSVAYPKLSLSVFKKKCCNGNGKSCTFNTR